MNWQRKTWAIEMRSPREDWRGPLFVAWADHTHPKAYRGEPSRPLLFETKTLALAWCRAKRDFYADNYFKGHVCREWLFRPVRVTESIVEIKK